jgi:ketosteroid isomerase-like protein
MIRESTMTDPAVSAFERFKAEMLSNSPTLTDGLWADDVVVESPFAPPGRPNRTEGLAAFRQLAETGRRRLGLHFDGFGDEVVHRTGDPATIVVEYRLTATAPNGVTASLPFVAVVGVDAEGRINRWREYQDSAGMQQALATTGAG